MVNLGSSARTAHGWTNIDSSLILKLGKHRRISKLLWKVGLLNSDRYARMQRLDEGCVVWNLAKGIPYPDRTFDVVYHSHLLEHIDREGAPGFLAECFRVLKPGGVIRIVVPDLEQLARTYVSALDGPDPASDPRYDHSLDEMFDQMVPRTPRWRAKEPLIVRAVERVFVGDTAKCGTLHRWMYDRHSVKRLLERTGFRDVSVVDYLTSRIAGWNGFGLDVEPDGSPYKPGSLYMEATTPQ